MVNSAIGQREQANRPATPRVHETYATPSSSAICQCPSDARKLVVALDGTSNKFGNKNTNVVELYARIEKNDNQRTYYNSGVGTYAEHSSSAEKQTRMDNLLELAFALHFEKIILGAYRWLSENYRDGDKIFIFGFSRGAYQARVLAGMIERVGLIFPGNEEQIPFAYELYVDSDGAKKRSNIFQRSFQRYFSRGKQMLRKHAPKRPADVGSLENLIDNESLETKADVGSLENAVLVDFDSLAKSPGFDIAETTPHPDKPKPPPKPMAARFKETFCWPGARVHFVGVWDTVSSVGWRRSCVLPLTHEHGHICFFRHALALDECRVKFLPEYIHGGESVTQDGTIGDGSVDLVSRPGHRAVDGSILQETPRERANHTKAKSQRRVKEVWFAGSHSDVGGGVKDNENLDVGDVPSLWMANEAMMAGLELKPSKVEWDWANLKKAEPYNSLTGFWKAIERLPITRLTYASASGTTRERHRGQGRIIKPGQLIHASVAFKQQGKYTPKAMFCPEMGSSWSTIIGKGRQDDIDWASDLAHLLELDLFDHSQAGSLIDKLRRKEGNTHDLLKRLSRLALYDAGIGAIVAADPKCDTLTHILEKPGRELQFASVIVLNRIAENWRGRDALSDGHTIKVLNAVASDPKYEMAQLGALCVLVNRMESSALNTEHKKMMSDLRLKICEEKTLESITKSLQSENAEVQGFGMQVVLFAAGDDKTREALVKTNAIAALGVMLRSPNVNVQRNGTQALTELVKHEKPREALLKSKVIDSFKTILKSQDSHVQRSGAQTLTELAQHANTREALLWMGAITYLNAILMSRDNYVQRNGGQTLTELAKYDNTRKALIEASTIDTLVGLLRSRDFNVQLRGTQALVELSKHEQARDAILRTNVIQAFGMMLTDKERHVQWTQADAEALSELAKNDKTRDALLKTNAISALDGLLESRDFYVQRRGTQALTEFAKHDKTRQALLNTKAIESFKMVLGSRDGHVQRNGAQTLTELAEHADTRGALLETSVIDTLTDMLNSRYPNVQFAGAQGLTILAKHADVRKALLAAGTVNALWLMLVSGSIFVKRKSAQALVKLAEYPEIRERILRTNAIRSLVNMLESQRRDEQTAAGDAISQLARHVDARGAILSAGAIGALATMLKSQDDDVQEYSVQALSELARDGNIRIRILEAEVLVLLENIIERKPPSHLYRRPVMVLRALLKNEPISAELAAPRISLRADSQPDVDSGIGTASSNDLGHGGWPVDPLPSTIRTV